MYYSLDALERAIHVQIENDHLESALHKLSDFVSTVISRPDSTGVVFSCATLDALCQKIGAKTFKDHPLFNSSTMPAYQEDLVVYIASEVKNSGGHNAVIKDLITLQPKKKHIILMTDLFERGDYQELEIYFAQLPVQLLWPSEKSFTAKLKWLQDKLLTLCPGRTFLFNHHHDSIAIAAVQPSINRELIFYHHGDHHLCLGVHLKHALHIDPHSFGFFNCRDKLKIKNNIYWPLVTLDRPYRSHETDFLAAGALKTCSSGNHLKFESPYMFSYLDLVPDILKITGGTHVHIGPLSSQSLEIIERKMKAFNISQDCFVHIPWVDSVWQAMLDHHIDLYINSFPRVGLKATIEVLGSGTPIIFHENYTSELLGGHFIGYPEAFVWRTPEQLLQHLAYLKADQLRKESKYAREHYEKSFKMELLSEELTKAKKDMKGFYPQPLSTSSVNQLQLCLDTMQRFDEMQKRLNDLQNQFDNFQKEMYASTSWRITAPLRTLKEKYSKCKKLLYLLISHK